jgi:hypothetical protein
MPNNDAEFLKEQERIAEIQREKILKFLKEYKIEIDGNLATSNTDYGTSHYIYVDGQKIRFSDHAVTNPVRQATEWHLKIEEKSFQSIEKFAYPDRFDRIKIDKPKIGAFKIGDEFYELVRKSDAEIKKVEKLTVNDLKDSYKKKLDFIDKSLNQFDDDIVRLQKELFNELITGVISELEVENGLILQSAKNIQILDNFGKEMELFKKNFADSVFKRLGENMIKTTGYTSDYFRLMSSKQTIANIEDKIQNIVRIAGVNTDGTLVKDGFLNKLAVSEELKGELSNLVRKSIEQQTDYKTFVNGMKDAITGKEGVNGAYERYVKGFAHDAFFAQAQQQDNFFADQLGLNYFVYGGTKIKTSRPFCVGGHDKGVNKDFESKLSKVFSRKDAEQFDNMEWSGKIPGIKFIVQKGGYQCRHELMWITKEAAKRKGYPVADGDEGTQMPKISKQQELKDKKKILKSV